jgi:hypothetical protein
MKHASPCASGLPVATQTVSQKEQELRSKACIRPSYIPAPVVHHQKSSQMEMLSMTSSSKHQCLTHALVACLVWISSPLTVNAQLADQSAETPVATTTVVPGEILLGGFHGFAELDAEVLESIRIATLDPYIATLRRPRYLISTGLKPGRIDPTKATEEPTFPSGREASDAIRDGDRAVPIILLPRRDLVLKTSEK